MSKSRLNLLSQVFRKWSRRCFMTKLTMKFFTQSTRKNSIWSRLKQPYQWYQINQSYRFQRRTIRSRLTQILIILKTPSCLRSVKCKRELNFRSSLVNLRMKEAQPIKMSLFLKSIQTTHTTHDLNTLHSSWTRWCRTAHKLVQL